MGKRTKKYHKIANAWDAYWFLWGHPKLNVRERVEIAPDEADRMEKEGFLITRDQLVRIDPGKEDQWWANDPTVHTRKGALYAGGKCYREWRHLFRRAIDVNLDIFYAKTNKPGGHGRVDDDKGKNKYIECWLEFGPIYYGYSYSGGEEPQGEWDTQTYLMHSQDPDLDTGGSTFDEGLIRLARNVMRKYGDYNPEAGEDGSRRYCGKPVCADCRDIGALSKRQQKKQDAEAAS